MNWYIGQPILAIKNSRCGKIKKGQEFIIKGLAATMCDCKVIHIDVGLKTDANCIWCYTCKLVWNSEILWKSEKLFAPLDQDISELIEILENKQPLEI